MKKLLILIIAAAISLVSAAQNPAKEILTKISQAKGCPFSKEDFDAIDWDNPNRHNTDEHLQFDAQGSALQMTTYYLDCFKRKDGNYTALLVQLTISINMESD